jgi:hypothetical protein
MAFLLLVQLMCLYELFAAIGFVIETADWRRAFGATAGYPDKECGFPREENFMGTEAEGGIASRVRR